MAYVSLSVAVFIILIKENKVLLLQRQNTGFNNGKWGTPAGRIEINESPTEAAIREAQEEVGINVKKEDLEKPLVIYHHDDKGERLHIYYYCTKWENEPHNAEPYKCSDLQWFNINELPQDLIIDHIKKAISLHNSKKRYLEYGF